MSLTWLSDSYRIPAAQKKGQPRDSRDRLRIFYLYLEQAPEGRAGP